MQVQAQLEDITSVRKKLCVKIPADVADGEFNRIADDFRRHARIPGFRPGKAPVALVKRRFFDDIKSELVRKLVPESYEEAVREHKVRPISRPNLENLHFQEGLPFSFEAHFEVKPEIRLPQYRGLSVEVEETEVTDEDVEQELKRLAEEHAQLVAVEDRPAADADYVTVDLKGEHIVEEGTRVPDPIDEEDVVVHVGDERTHQDFTEAVRGLNIGEEKTFEVEYAEDYPEEKLAGKRIRFTVQVTDIKRKELPELNDDLAREVGEFQTVEELKDATRKTLAQVNAGRRDSRIRQRLAEILADQTSFEVPEVLIDNRIAGKVRELAYSVAARGVDPSRANINWKRVREEFREDAEREARTNLIVDEIVVQEGLEASSEEIEQELHRTAVSTEQPIERVRQVFEQEGRMTELSIQVCRRKAMALVVEAARITT